MTEYRKKVSLIGAGPGDPKLLTLKALECIKAADVVVYDYLASSSLLKHTDTDAELIYAGKKGGDHTLTQDEINSLIVEKALQGLKVARLKGGDPFIFGRGGEEAQVLVKNGIPFEIVPGVTSAIAAPAYAGIPLTHRDHASSVSFVTGHEDPTKAETSINWECLAKGGSTLVFLMGVKNLSSIAANLVKHGRNPSTPVALVRWGTTPAQQTVTGTLSDIVEKVENCGLKPPAIIVVGEVVSLREELSWFDHLPLLGRKIVVTRARAQASDLVEKLSRLGAECIEIPAIKINPPFDNSQLENAVKDIDTYQWVVFTSVNGVAFFFETLFNLGKDVRTLGHLKFACIGPATRDKLTQFGIISDILPETYQAESVVEAFADQGVKGKHILLPRAMEARTVLPEELDKMGAVVDEVTAYVTTLDEQSKEIFSKSLENSEIDMVTFTSSSTVKNFVSLFSDSGMRESMKNISTACIGPITAQTAADLGITPDVSARTYTIDGLVEAVLNFYKQQQTQ